MNKKFRIFIGSSSEQENCSRYLQITLNEWSHSEIWSNGTFSPMETNIESIEKNFPLFDLFIFIVTPDDIIKSRTKKYYFPRDNVIFEIGVAMGMKGRHSTFMVSPKNINIKLPSDIKDLHIIKYDKDAPNLRAEFSMVSTLIKESISNEHNSFALRTYENLYEVNNKRQDEFKKIYEDVHKRIIGKSIIRKNWIIDLQYSIENIDNEQVIKEKIIWEYEINNITKNNVDFPLSIIQIQNDVNHLFTFSTVDELGKRKIIFDNNTVNEIYNINGIRKNQKNIIIEPYKNYYVHLDFEFLHYVSKLKPFIHNSLAPTQTTFGITLKVTLPENYNFSLLGIDGISPLKCEQFDNHKILNYKIPYILFPEQIIEYVVRKEDKYE